MSREPDNTEPPKPAEGPQAPQAPQMPQRPDEAAEGIPPRIVMLVDVRTEYGRGVLRGLAEYVSRHSPWLMYLDPDGKRMPDTGGWPVSGVIAGFAHTAPRWTEPLLTLRDQGIPIVATTPVFEAEAMAGVQVDDEAVGRLGAEDLIARGHRHFAFCGKPGEPEADRRQAGFQRTVEEAGLPCQSYEPGHALRQRWT